MEEENIFYINGFWKDDKTKFSGYKVSSYDDNFKDDDEVFFFGLSENDIKEAINLKWKTVHDFVITSYYK